MGIQKILVACIAFVVWDNLAAQVVTETLKVEGKTVRMQKLSMACDYWAPPSDDIEGWHRVQRTYTLHIIDKDALSTAKQRELRPQALGWYAWSSNEWLKFDYIDENAVWLKNETGIDFPQQSLCSRKYGCRYMATFEITLDRWKMGVDRSTLNIVTIEGEYSGTKKDGKGRSDEYDDPIWPHKPKSPEICRLIQYKQPPERLGF